MNIANDIDPRNLSNSELGQLGEDGLNAHLIERGKFAHLKHGGLRPDHIETFLADRDCVRHPTRLSLEFREMGPHQFAHAERDRRLLNEITYILYVRPTLEQRPDLMAFAIAYMIPVINYGEIVTDDHCLMFGATLMGMTETAFYLKVCEVADFVEAAVRFPDPVSRQPSTTADSPRTSCGSGCGCAA